MRREQYSQARSTGSLLNDLAPLSEAALLDARLKHNFEIARVCQRKYRALRVAMLSGVIGLAAMLVLIALLKLAPLKPPPPPGASTSNPPAQTAMPKDGKPAAQPPSAKER